METKPQTSKDYFRTLQIIYYALIAGQVIFGLVALFLNQMIGLDTGLNDLRNIFLFIVPIFIVCGYLASRILYKNSLKKAKSRASLIEKMSDYRAALVVRYALLEGPSFFAVVVYLITGDLSFLVMAGFIIAIFFTIKPTKDRAVRDLELSPYEEQSILDPDKVIAEIKLDK
jgi:MFS family permease